MHMHVSSSASSNYVSQLISDLDPAASTVNYKLKDILLFQ